MRPLIFFFQSPVNGSFRDQFEKLNGELLYLACPTRAFRKSSSWSKSKLINARGVVAIFLLSSSQLGVISYDGRYVSSGYLPSMFCALEVWPETRFSPSRRFLNVDCRCNSGLLKRIAYTTMLYTSAWLSAKPDQWLSGQTSRTPAAAGNNPRRQGAAAQAALRPRRQHKQPEATMRFETAPGEQAQVDWGSLPEDRSQPLPLQPCMGGKTLSVLTIFP